MNEKITGMGNIWCEIVADSRNIWNSRLTTFRLHYPRFIHSEFMTHRMFSRNASSSRAIPVSKMAAQVKDAPAAPVHWGANQTGMQAATEVEDLTLAHTKWNEAAASSVESAQQLHDMGLHKQIVNRVLEPFQFMNVIMSATDMENFFWLRCHKDAQPEIQELARVMFEAYSKSQPETLRHGEWHTPYVDHLRDSGGNLVYQSEGEPISLEDALAISSSCCAQVSYRNLDNSLEKAKKIFGILIEMKPLHASPFEHVATPFSEQYNMDMVSLHGKAAEMGHELPQLLYNGNFKGWNQYRKHLDGENITETFEKPVDNR